MKTKLSFLVAVIAIFVAAGCSAGSQDLNKDYMSVAADTRKDVDAMYKNAGGDYTKLSAEEHQRYLKYFDGKEEPAKAYWEKLKSGGAEDSLSGAGKR